MSVKLVAFDLDDTLLRDDLSVSEATLRIIERERARGVQFVPASGRRFNSMAPTCEAIGHRGPIITLNGAQVVDYPSGKILYERYVPLPLSLAVVRAAKELGRYIHTYVGDCFECEEDCPQSRLYERISVGPAVFVGPLDEFLSKGGVPSKKLLFVEEDMDAMRALEAEIHKRFDDELMVFRSKSFYLEVTHPEATKGAALAHICDAAGILRQQVLALGDGENDLTMLKYAGTGVAMGNAAEHVQREADFVTATNEEDGVAVAIEKFVRS